MSAEDLTTWGSFLSGLGTLIIALVGGAILAYDVRLRRRQLRETLSRSYSTLNVDFQVSVHPKLAASSAKPEWILEARVVIKNAGSEILAIPAVYVHARALPDSSDRGIRSFSEKDFGRLKPMGQLSEPTNIACFDSAIWHMGPDEVDSVVRWDILSDEFVQQHPVIIVRAQIYSVPNELIGATYSADSGANADRRQWLEFMGGDNGVRHNKVIFSHAHESVDGIKKGDWVFLKADNGDIDIEASKRFRKMLANFCHTGRQVIVVLNSHKTRELIDSSCDALPDSTAGRERPEGKRPTQAAPADQQAPLSGG